MKNFIKTTNLLILMAASCLVDVDATEGKSVGVDFSLGEPILYQKNLEQALLYANTEHAADIEETSAYFQHRENNNFVIIQVFRHAPGSSSSLLQWKVIRAADRSRSEDEIFLTDDQWEAFKESIIPVFPDFKFCAPISYSGIDPMTFIRVVIKTDLYQDILIFVDPLSSIDSYSEGKAFNAPESVHNAFKFICSLELLRRVSEANLFSSFSSVKNLGEAYLDSDEYLLLRMVKANYDDLSQAIQVLANGP